MKYSHRNLLCISALLAVLSGCAASIDDAEEIGQSVGDAMASVDESAGNNSGGFGWLPFDSGRAVRYAERTPMDTLQNWLVPETQAAACWATATFGTCTAGVMTRTFGGCTLVGVTLNGTVTLTFSDTACSMASTGNSVSRSPNFTLTGRRGATLTISPDNGGSQTVTRTGANAFTYSNSGIRRVATSVGGATLFDLSFKTTTAIGVTGATRATRVLDGGTLQITHNTKSYVVALSPSQVTWSSSCSCAVSGTWSGTVSGTYSGNFTVEITGCGTAKVTSNGASEDITLDRCAGV